MQEGRFTVQNVPIHRAPMGDDRPPHRSESPASRQIRRQLSDRDRVSPNQGTVCGAVLVESWADPNKELGLPSTELRCTPTAPQTFEIVTKTRTANLPSRNTT